MTSVGATDSQQDIIFRCKVEGDVALSLATVLAANEHIHESRRAGPKEAQCCSNARNNVSLRGLVSVDGYISIIV